MCSPRSSPSEEKTTTMLRRHKTLPGPLRSFPTRRFQINAMRLSKSNPYVGWFRHAPPSLKNLTDEAAEWLKASLQRHHYLRSSTATVFTKKQPSHLLTEQNRSSTQDVIMVFRALRIHWHNDNTGMLLGGTTKGDYDTSVLSKLAYWLLDVPLTDTPPSLQELDPTAASCKHASHDAASLASEEEDQWTVDSRDEVPRRATAPEDDDRLDYNITQMDIVRMNRIASRHLDVESIINLPTVTFQTTQESHDDNSFSWMMVHSDSEASEAEGDTEGCVICLEAFTPGDRLRILPCQHKFHISCIDRWLSGSNSEIGCVTSGCPTCKAPTASESLPGWAFARIGDALIRESQQLS